MVGVEMGKRCRIEWASVNRCTCEGYERVN